VTNDSLIVALLRKGDERAFSELVSKSHGVLIRRALRSVANRAVAEEVVQETWIAVIDGIHRFEGRSSLNTWIFSILIRKATDRGVRESRQINFSALASDCVDGQEEAVDPSRFCTFSELAGGWALPPRSWDELTPERLLASKQAFKALSKAVDELPPLLREVLMCKDVEGLESKDICKQLEITETNLYVRLHRARERVRKAVEIAQLSRSHLGVSNSGVATLI
jgi:RNA polymerase sigma-70 factor (ECF subfamily)